MNKIIHNKMKLKGWNIFIPVGKSRNVCDVVNSYLDTDSYHVLRD